MIFDGLLLRSKLPLVCTSPNSQGCINFMELSSRFINLGTMSPIGHGSMSVIKCIVWITQWSWTTMNCPFIWIAVILALSIMWLFFHELDLYNTNFFVHIDKYLSTLLGETCWKVACIMGKATWSCYFATKKTLFRIGRYYLPIIQHVEGLIF